MLAREISMSLSKQLGVVIVHRVVTLTGCCFESLPVKDTDLTTIIANELSLLQCACSDGDATPAHTEHVAEVLMCEIKIFGVRAVMCH